MLKPGDTVTLSIAPKVWLTKFHAFSPHASITRVVGENPEQDIKNMQSEVQSLVWSALQSEIEVFNEATDVLGGVENTDQLLELCKRKTHAVHQTVTKIVGKPRTK